MRLIDRYLLRQMLGPTLLATGALTAVALLSQSLAGLDLIVNQRQSAAVFLKITLLYMPQLLNMVLPVAVFVAALVGFNRLHTEQEIVVSGTVREVDGHRVAIEVVAEQSGKAIIRNAEAELELD